MNALRVHPPVRSRVRLLRSTARAAPLLVALVTPAAATEVTFRFEAPAGATRVSLAGTFNEWDVSATPMADRDADGVWEVVLELAEETFQYKFVVDGRDWITDETASEFADDGFGGLNSVLHVGRDPLTVGRPPGDPPAPSGTEVTFRFRPPGFRPVAVSVAGTFNGWNAAAHSLFDPDGDDLWECRLRLEPGRHAYQFVVDGDWWLGDDSARSHEPDGFGGRNAVLEVGPTPVIVGSGT